MLKTCLIGHSRWIFPVIEIKTPNLLFSGYKCPHLLLHQNKCDAYNYIWIPSLLTFGVIELTISGAIIPGVVPMVLLIAKSSPAYLEQSFEYQVEEIFV